MEDKINKESWQYGGALDLPKMAQESGRSIEEIEEIMEGLIEKGVMKVEDDNFFWLDYNKIFHSS